jgi:hypothetical protein
MTDTPDTHKVSLEVVMGMLEVFFRSFVEDGEIEIGVRSSQDIFRQFEAIANEIVEGDDIPFHASIDHRDGLLDRAIGEAAAGHAEMSATLYAIWIEHFVNGIISRMFERRGHGDDVALPFIKELRLVSKVTALWRLLGLPALSEDEIKVMNRIIEFRNAFVHYKWSAKEAQAVDDRRAQVQSAINEAPRLISALQAAESFTYWNGRESELIDEFREGIKKRWEEDPFSFVVPRSRP